MRVLFNSSSGPQLLHIANYEYKHLPLHEAAALGKVDAVAQLIEWGTPIDSQQWTGGTPFYQACEFGELESAKMLLNMGADPDVRDQWGQSALDVAIRHNCEAIVDLIDSEPRCAKLVQSAGDAVTQYRERKARERGLR